MFRTLALCALFVGCAVAQSATTFQADISVYNDPSMLGSVDGVMYYDQAGTGFQRIDYTISGPGFTSVKEIIDYGASLRYLYCASCDTETFRKTMNKYNREAADTALPSSRGYPDTVTVGGRSCTGRLKAVAAQAEGKVFVIYNDAAGLPCRAVMDDDTVAGTTNPGRYIDFTNIVALPSNPFLLYQSWNCPQPQCTVKIDLYIVFDESGSVSSGDFTKEKQFGVDISNSYTIGPDNVQVGLSLFGSSGRTAFHLRNNQANVVNGINAVGQRGGGTCIPCGIEQAVGGLNTYGRAGVGKVIILLTDGGNNVRTSELPTLISNAQNAGILMFCIGVGTGYNLAQVQAVGYSGSFAVNGGFGALGSILSSLITQTCRDLPGNPCGTGCRGFCACQQLCICPPTCTSPNACDQGTCTAGVNGNGCVFAPATTSCSDNNACTDDTCNRLSGVCVNTPKVCDDAKKCTTDTCSTATGCVYVPNTCNDNDPCTLDVCGEASPGDGCTHPAQPCALCTNSGPPDFLPTGQNPCVGRPADTFCVKSQCNQTGTSANCDIINTDCDDGNPCSVDSCDVATSACVYTPQTCSDGNLCTLDMCNSTNGCVFPTDPCDDNNLCTTDSCNPATGCVHTPIVCDDLDICTVDTCQSAIGCVYLGRDCSQDPQIQKFQGDCHYALCETAKGGCYLEHINGTAAVDDCGICGGDGQSCAGEVLETSEAVAIGTVALVFIILGAIALFALIAFIGGKKGYDVYMRNKGTMFGATSSPLYSSGNLTGESALYDGKE